MANVHIFNRIYQRNLNYFRSPHYSPILISPQPPQYKRI